MLAGRTRICGIVKLDINKQSRVDIPTEHQSCTAELESLVLAYPLVALLAFELGIGFQKTVVAKLGVSAQADFVVPFGYKRSSSGFGRDGVGRRVLARCTV